MTWSDPKDLCWLRSRNIHPYPGDIDLKEITFYLEPGASSETDWRQEAACRNTADPDLFFPVGSSGPALEQIQKAKAVCRVCQVRRECLQWALETNQDSGVWGGLSEEERKMLARRRRQELLVSSSLY